MNSRKMHPEVVNAKIKGSCSSGGGKPVRKVYSLLLPKITSNLGVITLVMSKNDMG